MAGMAAEQIVLGEHSTGSGGEIGSDLAVATRLLTLSIGSLGLGEGPKWLGEPSEMDEIFRRDPYLRRDVDRGLADALAAAIDLLSGRRVQLEELVRALLDRSVLEAEDIIRIAAGSTSRVSIASS